MRPKIRLYNLLEEEFNTELFNSMAACGMPDIAHLLHNDPDLINIGGRHIPFRRIETSGTTWIAYLNSNRQVPRKRIRVILLAFFSAKPECFELRESSWTQFKDKCIAYRGDGNYGYTIWQYKGEKEKKFKSERSCRTAGQSWRMQYVATSRCGPSVLSGKIILALLRYFPRKSCLMRQHPPEPPYVRHNRRN